MRSFKTVVLKLIKKQCRYLVEMPEMERIREREEDKDP